MRTYRLDDTRQTLVLAAKSDRLAEVIYWGAPLPATEDLTALAKAHAIDVTGGMLDENPDLSICPEAARTFPGQPGLAVRDATGTPILPRFRYASDKADTHSLTLTYRDDALGLTYSAHFALDPETHVITTQADLNADAPVHLSWLSAPVIPAPQQALDMIDVSGRWCGEFQLNHIPWTPGARLRENRTGRTGHEHFPALIVTAPGTTNTQGDAWAFHYGWSGGHRMVAEELPDGRRQIQFGHATDTARTPGTQFQTAPLYLAYSATGLNGTAVAFQRHTRDRIVDWSGAKTPRPVHYNCWEAIYFDHDLNTLKDIASRAAALGAERFVLDDGWFGTRDDDTTSLGDWQIDPRKFPDGLTPLIDHIHREGMTFGLWFEPEMINPNSALYRAHPDWALGDKDQVLGRYQMALDMANADVRDHIFSRISAILADHAIDYIKWDHNRVLPIADQAQTTGTYALLDRLRAAFPNVEVESCASGGGRIDLGILSRTQRVWLSDSNDALERLPMQHNAALFLPAAVTGSHVGPRKSHTSGRQLDIRIRAWTAAARHMGFEMDPRELTDDETTVLTHVTRWWKSNRDWLLAADILRLDSADPNVIAEQHLARDQSRFVAFVGKRDTSAQIAPRPLRLTGLDPDAVYRVDLANRADLSRLSRGDMALKDGPLTLSGQAFMTQGLTLPWSCPGTIWVLDGQRI